MDTISLPKFLKLIDSDAHYLLSSIPMLPSERGIPTLDAVTRILVMNDIAGELFKRMRELADDDERAANALKEVSERVPI